MSLLDDVSIVVTPNGYKAGELYAVIPVPTEGAEEGTNMDFSSGTSPWALNSNWSLGGVGVIADGTSNSTVWQNSVVEDNKQYIVTYTLTDFLQGTVNVELAGSHGISRTIAGTYTEVITSGTSPTTRITFEGSGNFQVTLSNVIVKEWTGADMDVTRATDATRVDENGLIEDVLDNVPRIDYTGGGCPHILAEPQRTNLVTYSEDFSQTKWTGSPTTADVTVTTNTNPSGASGTYSVENVTGTQLGSFYTITSGVDYTNSFYVRNISGSGVISLKDINNSGTEFTATSEWQKFSVTGTSNSTTGRIYLSVTTLGDIVEVWGASLELGSYPTSLIPTSGSTVTRNQDIFSRDGIGSLINSTEGVLFLEMAALSDDGTNKRISLSDGTNTNRVVIAYSTSNNIQIFIVGAPAGTFAPSQSIDITLNSKIAVSWSSTEARFYVDGSPILVTLGDFSYSASTLSELKTEDGAGGNKFFGKVKQLQVYDTALTDTQLAALTS